MAEALEPSSGLPQGPEAWEVEEGIPQMHEAVMQKYFDGRDALIDQEDGQSSDHSFRELLSPLAREACSIANQIRWSEQQSTWADPAQTPSLDIGPLEMFPGMMFNLGKGVTADTKLFDIVRRMPKGALLHCHLEAMIDTSWLCNQAFEIEGIHMAAEQPLSSSSARKSVPFTFRFTRKHGSSGPMPWADSYQPGALVPMTAAADAFPDGGRTGFVRWFKSRTTVTLEESIAQHLGARDVWSKFVSCFGILKTLLYYEPLYRRFLQRFFTELVEDKVSYVEIRAAFMFEYRREGSEDPDKNYNEVIRVLGEELEKFKATESGKEFWGARWIWTAIRSAPRKAIVDNMYDCLEAKLAHPELIAGYDLVGHEDPGPALAELMPLLFHFRRLCAEEKVNIPFFFHAGETATSGTDVDQNLFDAMLLGSRRLGHATSLYKHPILMKMTKDRHVCVECCPISNEVLRLTASVTAHPLPAMIAHGVPVALSNDDPGILGQDSAGLSFDFWQTMQSIESIGLEGLGSLAENSVRYAAYEDQDAKTWAEDIKQGAYGTGLKAQRMKAWKHEWEKFAQWLVMEHGVDVNLEEQD